MSCGTLGASDAGKDWGVERESYIDPVTQVRVWELTKAPGIGDNLYFHFSNFTADNRHLIFVSTRSGSRQIFRAEIETGKLAQLTDGASTAAHGACPDHTNARRVYYLRGPEVFEREADKTPSWDDRGFLSFMNKVVFDYGSEIFRDFNVTDPKQLALLIMESLSIHLGSLMPDVRKSTIIKLNDHFQLGPVFS